MKVSTTSNLDESKYEVIEVVHGVSIRSFSFFRQVMGGLRSLMGGKATEFEEKYVESWNEAWGEMVKAAAARGAEAVYGARMQVSEISMGRSDGMVLLAATGTAVRKKQTGGGLRQKQTGGLRRKQTGGLRRKQTSGLRRKQTSGGMKKKPGMRCKTVKRCKPMSKKSMAILKIDANGKVPMVCLKRKVCKKF